MVTSMGEGGLLGVPRMSTKDIGRRISSTERFVFHKNKNHDVEVLFLYYSPLPPPPSGRIESR